MYLSPFKDVQGSRIIYAGPSKCFTRIDDDQNQESNHAIYTVSCVDIMGGSCNTEDFSKPVSHARVTILKGYKSGQFNIQRKC